ncbi:PepSY domain-containing protein [Chryseobacterium sp. BIGb0232]|uniref:PepSY-associated TM helix domain-containing protein n=1 Tax=Chryseobacterium sp. BIGb0232 TaxID=2940598 RepID=UPI000F472499|nr:PepSY-associated TM helix domain-containing protein [Chryseobacterium sp. BIGb0232]MCS4303000.1 putative iron-regulated membrane protein [Chryseobacterium sp. BIGb0232]ROS14708.1 putative iron-regulated membrane protein [Chryseobacterium nakagawai]
MKTLFKSLYRKRRKNESLIKYVMWIIHLWLGLLSCVIIFIVCLSGCLYAFKNQIIDFTNRDKVYISETSTQVKNPDLIQAELLKQNKELTSLLIPDDKGRSYVIGYRENQLDKSTYYNQYTGTILGQPEVGSGRFFEIVLDIHRNLMMGNAGRQILGAGVLMFCVLLISGVILWLPKKLKFLKQGLTVMFRAKFQRVNYDLHNTLGFYTFLILFFIAVTGLYVTYPWVKNGLIVSLGGSSIDNISKDTGNGDDAFGGLLEDMLQKQDEKKNLKDSESASIDEILQLADQYLPYTAVTSIELPNKDNPRYVVIKTNTQNFLGMMLPDEVTFDKTGNFKTKELFADKPLNKQFTSLAKPLHTGEIMGLPSIILYFIVSFIGCSLPVTGFLIWWHRFRKIK